MEGVRERVMAVFKARAERRIRFSKHRRAVERKGSQLATLCGAEVATILFSPDGEVFSSFHPNDEAKRIIGRFLDEVPIFLLDGLIEAEKQKGEEIDKIRRETEGTVWWEKPIEELNVEQMEMLLSKMRDFKENLCEEVRVLQLESELNEGANAPSNVNVAGSSGEIQFQQVEMGQGGASVDRNAPAGSSHGGDRSFL